jgi:DNA-binding MarR family transcriptional regulator
MFETSGSHAILLNPVEMRILKFIKPKSQTEKKISKVVEIDALVLSPVITDLILKGYLEIVRRRRFYFFSREFCTITPEGVSALEKARSPLEGLVEMVRNRALDALNSIAAGSPALKAAVFSARTLYKVAKAVA